MWVDKPAIDQTVAVVPTPDEVRLLVEAAHASKRPEYARFFFSRRRPACVGLRCAGCAEECGTELPADAFVFSDAPDGSEPWRPDATTQYFIRLRRRTRLCEEIQLKHLRKFMDTYGQELGFGLTQVALRAGHDPAVAACYYTGRVDTSDHALAASIEDLLSKDEQGPKRDRGTS